MSDLNELQQEVARQEFARREMARRRLLPYVIRFKPEYMVGWVHKVFAAKLERFYQDVQDGKQPRLMIFVPPRHGKSELVSVNFPSWALGKDPTLDIIMSSYSITLPTEFSKDNRARMFDERYRALFPNARIAADSKNAERWKTSAGGGLKCAGVGGGISGFGADILIIDDPVKDYEDSQSETIREIAKNWYTTTADSRLSPKGGVIVVQCMVGDTMVLMSDGAEKRLDEVRVGDQVATYDEGRLSTSRVLNWASQGHDTVFEITTRSGRKVRANERHPFLVRRNGELRWVRLRNLASTDTLIAHRKDHTRAKSAPILSAGNLLSVGGSAPDITTNGSGPVGIVRRLAAKIHRQESALSSSIGTALRWTTTKIFWMLKTANVLFAGWNQQKREIPVTGPASCASITATTPALFEGYYATDATLLSGEIQPLISSNQLQNIFEMEEIENIERVGVEEVFDVQIERTENFIANGLVSHNTRWHDDDLSGWRLRIMEEARREGVPEEELEQWDVVSFPAIAEHDEYLDTDCNLHESPGPGRFKVRSEGDPLHAPRYPLSRLKRIRAGMPSQQWSALYQQNPVPDSGDFFEKQDFIYYNSQPVMHQYPVLFAWDLAVGEKRTNDYSVGLAGVVIPRDGVNTIKILDMFRGRVRDRELTSAIVNMWLRYKNNAHRLGIEYGQIFLSIEKMLMREFAKHKVSPSIDRELKPINDKRVRATPARGWMQHHRIEWPKGQPWVSIAENELLRFDAGVNDDIVDALAWMVRMAEKMPLVKPAKEQGSVYGHDSLEQQVKDYLRDQKQGSGQGYMTA